MTDYDLFAKHYDDMMGDRSSTVNFLKELIQENNKNPKTLLELACGTGAVLEYFAKDFQVFWLDLSAGMLEVAKQRIPSGTFIQEDMTTFKFDQKFDVIFCVFDSINHLLAFSQWQNLFKSAHEHLNDWALFIFDINTKAKLKKVTQAGASVRRKENSLMIMDVTQETWSVTNRNIKVFEREKDDLYRLYEENIKETAFSVQEIKVALKKYFISKTVNPTNSISWKKSGRVFFICKKKPTVS